MNKWEEVDEGDDYTHSTYRMKVEGGYLYRRGEGLCFVAAPRVAHQEAFPSIHRQPQAKAASAKDTIDAEFTEVPADEVNGSEVTPEGEIRDRSDELSEASIG